jgi:hypothetical protein
MRSNAVGGVLYFKLGVGRCSYNASTVYLFGKSVKILNLFTAVPVFLVSVIGVIIFNFLASMLKLSGKKYSLASHLVEIDLGSVSANP